MTIAITRKLFQRENLLTINEMLNSNKIHKLNKNLEAFETTKKILYRANVRVEVVDIMVKQYKKLIKELR